MAHSSPAPRNNVMADYALFVHPRAMVFRLSGQSLLVTFFAKLAYWCKSLISLLCLASDRIVTLGDDDETGL